MALRLDFNGSFGSGIEETPQGGLKVPAFLTRTGVFEYRRLDGTMVREYRPPEEVFSSESMRSLAGAPVTDRHPATPVNPKNFKSVAAGYVHGEARKDGDRIAGDLIIQDESAIQAVREKKRREVSCGYNCDVDNTPGVTPSGEPYDRVQRNIRYNHVAIVEKGRAGSEVRLRLDANDNLAPETAEDKRGFEMDPKEIAQLIKEKAEAQARVDAAEARAKTAEEKATEATKRADEATARADAADAKVKELSDPKRMDSMVADRVAIVTKAAGVLGPEFKADGLAPREIMTQAIVKAFPDFKADGKSDDYIRARFDALEAKTPAQPARSDSAGGFRQAAAAATLGQPGQGGGSEQKADTVDPCDANAAYNRMVERNRQAANQPLAYTKG